MSLRKSSGCLTHNASADSHKVLQPGIAVAQVGVTHAIPAQIDDDTPSIGSHIVKASLQPSYVVGKEGDDLVASALDFLPDGSFVVHHSLNHINNQDDAPQFACSVPPNSIRVIFYDAEDVFQASSSELDLSEDYSSTRIVPYCTDCVPIAEMSSDEGASVSRRSFVSASLSHISPKAKGYTSGCSLASSERHGRRSPDRVNSDQDGDLDRSQSTTSRKSLHSSNTPHSWGSSIEDDEEEDEKDWKRYRGGSSLNAIEISQIWDRTAGGALLPIGVNLMFDLNTDSDRIDHDIWYNQIRDERHTLTFKEATTSFFTVPNLLQSLWLEHENSLQVTMRIYSTLRQHVDENPDQARSPLGERLWDILLSKKSAMSLFNGNTEIGACLLAFDVLAAVSDCWLTFLDLVRSKSAWGTRTGFIEFLNPLMPVLGDREYLSDFARSIRDLSQALDTTIEAIEIAEDFNKEQKIRFQYLLLDRRTLRRVLQSTMTDIENYIDDQTAQAERIASQRKDASLKRLTLVASIFLPLTTACSLLSMTNRVKDIGPIWWDWLGIVVIIGFLVIVGYRVTSSWHSFWQEPMMQRTAQSWARRWRQAKDEVYAAKKRNKPRPWRRFDTRKSRPLIPASSRFTFRGSKYVFAVAAVASFLVGMFVSVSKGAQVLGYSAAGSLLLAVAVVLVWQPVKFIIVKGYKPLVSLIRRVREDRERKKYVSETIDQRTSQSLEDHGEGEETSTTSPRRSQKEQKPGENKPSIEQQRPKPSAIRLVGRVLVYIVKPIRWILNALYWIFSIFFGDEIVPVVGRVIIAMVSTYMPVTTTTERARIFRYLRAKTTLGKGQLSQEADDVEPSDDGELFRTRSRSRDDEEKVLGNVKKSKTRQDKEQSNLEERKHNDANEDRGSIRRAKTWTKDRTRRTPTQTFFIRGHKIQRRANTLPMNPEKRSSKPNPEARSEPAKDTDGMGLTNVRQSDDDDP